MSPLAEYTFDTLTDLVLSQVRKELAMQGWYQVEASGRHVHVTAADAMTLFGDDYALAWSKYLSQPGQFVSEQRVTLVGPKGRLEGAVVIGPERNRTQVEVSKTDALLLGVNPPCRDSGNLDGTSSIRLEHGNAHVETNGGLIVAERHIHMRPEAAEALKLSDGDHVDFVLDSPRPLTFMDVKVRVSNTADDFMHIDYDEANAAGFSTGMFGCICRDSTISERRICMDTEKLVEEVLRRLIKKIHAEQAENTTCTNAGVASGDCSCCAADTTGTITDANTGAITDANTGATLASDVCEMPLQKRQLVTESVAMRIAQHSQVRYPKGTVITPLAKDVLKQRSIVVEFE